MEQRANRRKRKGGGNMVTTKWRGSFVVIPALLCVLQSFAAPITLPDPNHFGLEVVQSLIRDCKHSIEESSAQLSFSFPTYILTKAFAAISMKLDPAASTTSTLYKTLGGAIPFTKHSLEVVFSNQLLDNNNAYSTSPAPGFINNDLSKMAYKNPFANIKGVSYREILGLFAGKHVKFMQQFQDAVNATTPWSMTVLDNSSKNGIDKWLQKNLTDEIIKY